MGHAESCEPCGSFWLELQSAQQLTLSLSSDQVGSDFREQLWERISAGEGTPSSVFQESVPLWSKLRYTLTGAAAAAALLIGINYLSDTTGSAGAPSTIKVAQTDHQAERSNTTSSSAGAALPTAKLASTASSSGGGDLGFGTGQGLLEPRQRLDWTSQPSWAKPLSYEVVALETSRQFEDRYMTAERGMRNMHNPAFNQGAAIKAVLSSADEMRDFGQLLLDLRERQALFFTDANVDVELRVAVKMLGQVAGFETPDAQTLETFVAPILQDKRLGKISDAISLKPRNHHEEVRHLMVLNLQRPELFSKLFFILGDLQAYDRIQSMRPGTAFLLGNDCESRLVAPRSEVNANFMRVQVEWTQNR
jgi:hypothetical protein